MTARRLRPPARPGVTPAGQVAGYTDRAGQGDGTFDDETGRLTRFRPYGAVSPEARGYVFRPYVRNAPRPKWATRNLTGYPYKKPQLARARRAAGQQQEERRAA